MQLAAIDSKGKVMVLSVPNSEMIAIDNMVYLSRQSGEVIERVTVFYNIETSEVMGVDLIADGMLLYFNHDEETYTL